MRRNDPVLPLGDYLLEISRQILEECRLPEIARTQTAVTLRRRFRGTSKSDLLGCFDRASNIWLGDGVEVDRLMDMHSFQIVKPVIRANQSAMVQAQVECEINPTSHQPSQMGIAAIARGIYRYLNNHPDYWSNSLENQIAQQCQTDPGYFIHTYYDPDAESPININIDEYADEPTEMPGRFACPKCGAGGPFFSAQMGEFGLEQVTVPCLQCGNEAEIVEWPEMSDVSMPVGKVAYKAGNIVMDVICAWAQIRIDEKHTKNGQVRRARWLEHHFLMDEEDLQAQVPYFDLGVPSEWSYPIQWEHALESGTDLYLKPWNASYLSASKRRQHEVRRIYLRPSRYKNYRAPGDFALDRGDGRMAVDHNGEPMLMIRRGEWLFDRCPNGFWYTVSSERLLPWADKDCDLRNEWSYGGFLNDAASFWYQSASELNELQRTANNLWTIDVQHRESGSITTTAYDREWFDADDFERQLMPTKEGVHIDQGDTINNHFAEVRPPQMTGAMEGIQFVRSIIGDVSGPQPATVGAPAKGEPYAAQRLQVQQSLGLLTPSQQSKAECKSNVILQGIKHWQQRKPLEWYKYIATMYGEEWKDQDIEAFIEADLDLSLTVWYKEGSETPTSLIERELKYRQFLIDMAQASQFTETNLVTPEMISKYAQISGMDYDIENVEADTRLADSRYQKFKAWVEFNRDVPLDESVLIDLALSGRDFNVMPMERHETHIEFYMDHARPLLATDHPNYVLVGCCLEMIKRHEKAAIAQDQVASERKVEGSAPELAAQAMAMQAQQQAELAKLQAQVQMKQLDLQNRVAIANMTLQAKAVESEEDRALEAEMHADEMGIKAEEIKAQASEGGETEAPDEDAIDVVTKSAKYVDLPPVAQTAVLRRMGLPAGGTKEVHDATLTKQQIAAQKVRARQSSSNGSNRSSSSSSR